MSKGVIIGIFVAILAVGGGAFAFLSNGEDDENSSNVNTATQDNGSQQQSVNGINSTDNPLGVDLSAIQGPYRITVNTTGSDGRVTNAVTDVDADGNIHAIITDQGAENQFISVNGEIFSLVEGQDSWLKFPSTDAAPINVNELNTGYSQADIDELNDLNINDRGTGPCTAGTCRIYDVTDPESGDTTTAKVDTGTNRLSDIEFRGANGEMIDMSYDYDYPVNITAPENFTEFQVPDLSDFDINNIPELQ